MPHLPPPDFLVRDGPAQSGRLHRLPQKHSIRTPAPFPRSQLIMCVPQAISFFMKSVVRWGLLVTICLIAPPAGAAPKYTDYKEMGVQYDEYPVVVPKRAAMLLDRIMVALQKAVDDDTVKTAKTRIPIEDTMDLQRRGQQKGGRIYWRCYFNAVTCF